jgi:hypothetical protein
MAFDDREWSGYIIDPLFVKPLQMKDAAPFVRIFCFAGQILFCPSLGAVMQSDEINKQTREEVLIAAEDNAFKKCTFGYGADQIELSNGKSNHH